MLAAMGLLLLSCLSAVEKSFHGMKEGLSSYNIQQLPTNRHSEAYIFALDDTNAAELLEDFSKEKYISPRENHQNEITPSDRLFSMTLHHPKAIHPILVRFDFNTYLRNFNTSHLIPILKNLRL